jgi:hypothetical protein
MEHEDVHAAEVAFIEGFRAASDKQALLSLAHIPLELAAADGPGLKLVQVLLEETVEVGRASRGFASRELVYQPLPARLVTAQIRLRFRYISAEAVRELSFAEVMSWPDAPHGHAQAHEDAMDASATAKIGRHGA